MKKFTTNFENVQMSLDYAIYMIVGSYFGKAVCCTTFMEKKLHLMYGQESLSTQYFLEEICDRYVKQNILPEFPAMERQNVEVFIERKPGSSVTSIIFEGKGFELIIRDEHQGRKCKITHSLCKYAWYEAAQAASGKIHNLTIGMAVPGNLPKMKMTKIREQVKAVDEF